MIDVWPFILGLILAALVFSLFTELSRRPDGSVGLFSSIMNLGVATICLLIFGGVWIL